LLADDLGTVAVEDALHHVQEASGQLVHLRVLPLMLLESICVKVGA
jgi:hypothetical protein